MKSTDAMYGIGMGTINLATILGALSMGAAAKKMRMENLHRLLAAITLLFLPMALSVHPCSGSDVGFYPSYLVFLACARPHCHDYDHLFPSSLSQRSRRRLPTKIWER